MVRKAEKVTICTSHFGNYNNINSDFLLPIHKLNASHVQESKHHTVLAISCWHGVDRQMYSENE